MVSPDGGTETANLRLLGGFELRMGGGLASLPTSSERVVAFLALHDQQASRGLVAGTLWPDSPEDKARGSLRSALWRLQLTAKDVVHATAATLRLADRVEVDLYQCRDLASRARDGLLEAPNGHPQSLCRMLSAELLPGWYEDWVLLEAERWRQVRLHELESIARQFIELGRYSDAVLIALEAKDAEPLRESSRALLIEAHLHLGNRNEALRQFELYRKVMAEELGLEPTLQLHALVEGGTQLIPTS